MVPRLFLAAAVALTLASPQTPGTIQGFVVDRDGGVIPGCTVILGTAEAPKLAVTTSNSQGLYRFQNLAPGDYQVVFALQGFHRDSCDVKLQSGATATSGLALRIGSSGGEPDLGAGATPAVIAVPMTPEPTLCFGNGEIPAGMLLTNGPGVNIGSIFMVVDVAHAQKTATQFLRQVGAYKMGEAQRVPPPPLAGAGARAPRDPIGSQSVVQFRANPAAKLPELPAISFEPTTVTGLRHRAGTLSMTRQNAVLGTPAFMILLDDDSSFDAGGRRYADLQGAAAFGRVIRGLDVLRNLGSSPVTISYLSAVNLPPATR